MEIIARCPNCGGVRRLGCDAADRRVRCMRCKRMFKIPRLEELQRATEVLRRAKGTIYVDEGGKTYG